MARTLVLSAALWLAAVAAGAQPLSLAIQDGRVTLEASGVSVQQVLAEWARVGGTRVVGADRLSVPPLTLTLADVPERQALDIILRGAAGFVAAPRTDGTAGASVFDRIIVMASSSTAGAARRPGGASTPVAAPVPMAEPDPPAEVPVDESSVFPSAAPEESPFGQPLMPGDVNPFSQPNPSAQTPQFGAPTPFGRPLTPVESGAQPLVFSPVPQPAATPTPFGTPNPFGAPAPANAPVFVPFGSPTPGVVTQPPQPAPARPPGA